MEVPSCIPTGNNWEFVLLHTLFTVWCVLDSRYCKSHEMDVVIHYLHFLSRGTHEAEYLSYTLSSSIFVANQRLTVEQGSPEGGLQMRRVRGWENHGAKTMSWLVGSQSLWGDPLPGWVASDRTEDSIPYLNELLSLSLLFDNSAQQLKNKAPHGILLVKCSLSL